MSIQAGRAAGAGRLAGKACVVTGSSGLAADAALRFVREGAEVLVVARERIECESLGLPYALADLGDEAETEEAFAQVRTRLGRLDALYAVAGGSGRGVGDGPLHKLSLAAWESTFALNATPAFLAAREGVRLMLAGGTGGSIVVVSSVLAYSPAPSLFGTHAYAATKAAALGMVRAAAAYYAQEGIRVNALAPAVVTTPMSTRAAEDPTTVEFVRHKQPLTAGFLNVADVTEGALYLCSDAGRAITGQVLGIDAGWTISEGHPPTPGGKT